jgi:hypothetical protein
MKHLIDEYVNSFIRDEKGITFNDFMKYFYFGFDKRINNEKSKSLKNKYIKMRQSIIKYIVDNKRLIINQIKRKINHK